MTTSRETIGALSKATGVNIETIRYYERVGLVPKPRRSDGGRRIYGETDRKRLTFVRRCRELGFPLDDIRGLLDLAAAESRLCRDVKNKTKDHLQAVRGKIAELKRMEATLVELTNSCNGGDSPDCPILDRLLS